MLEAALPSPQAAPAYDKDGREIPPMTLANMRTDGAINDGC